MKVRYGKAFDSFRLSIFGKLAAVFFVFILILFFVNLKVNFIGSSSIKGQITELLSTRFNYYANRLDEEMQRIRLQQVMLMQDKDLRNIAYSSNEISNFEWTMSVNRVLENLQKIKYSSGYINNVFIHFNTNKNTLSINKGLDSIPNSDYSLIETGLNLLESPVVLSRNGNLLIIDWVLNNQGYDYLTYIELSSSKMKSEMTELLNLYEGSGSFILDKDGQVLLDSATTDDVTSEVVKSIYKKNEGQEIINPYILNMDKKTRYWIYRKSILSNSMTLVTFIPENKVIGPFRQYNLWSELLWIALAVYLIIFTITIRKLVHSPLKRLVTAFKSVQADNLEVSIPFSRKDEFGYLYKGFNTMVEKIRKSIHEVYEHKIALQRSELKRFQSQINPHFLYNAFFNIRMMCLNEEISTISDFTERLGRYYQYITRSGSDEVPLKMELRHVMDYSEIQKTRFEHNVETDMSNLPENIENILVPRLIIQPILENIYEHAFPKNKRENEIYIKTFYSEGKVFIQIEDNGTNLSDSDIEKLKTKLDNYESVEEKTGIINVHLRLRLKFGKESGLSVIRSVHGGLRVDIAIFIGEVLSNVPSINS